jgi:phage terminase small subunit
MARKPTLGTRYSRIRTVIKKCLQDREVYDAADDILIDELLYNLKISDDAKADIKSRGYQINVVTDPNKNAYYQQNPSVGTYLQTVKNVGMILSKLGITVQERTKLSLAPNEPDPLADLFGGKMVANKSLRQ